MATEVARAAVESNVRSLTASESALWCQIAQVARNIKELGDQGARMRQERDCKLEYVFFERDGLHLRLDSTV